MNDVWKEVRRAKNPTLQAVLLSAHNSDRLAASWWINYERQEWSATDNGGVELVTLWNVPPKDRGLMCWLLEQDPHVRITWRHVQAAFPEYGEDQASRALRRVKKIVENKLSS